MKKTKELLYLEFRNGMYLGHIFNRADGVFETYSYLWYSKREVIQRLRDAGVIVSKKSLCRQ